MNVKVAFFFVLFALITLAVLMPAPQPVIAGGCAPNQLIYSADNAVQLLRYNNRGAADAVFTTARIANKYSYMLPERYVRRARLAKIYVKMRKPKLALYHLYYLKSHPCW